MPVEARHFPRLGGAKPINPIVSEIEQGTRPAIWQSRGVGQCKVFFSNLLAPGVTIPFNRATPTLLQPKFCSTNSTATDGKPSNFIYFIFSDLHFIHLISLIISPSLVQLHVNPRPAISGLLSRHLLYCIYCAALSCSRGVELHAHRTTPAQLSRCHEKHAPRTNHISIFHALKCYK